MIPPLVLALFVVGLLPIIWFEWRRTPAIRRLARISAGLLVVLGLLLLIGLGGGGSSRRILTPGAPVSARSREAIWLERLPSAARLWAGEDPHEVQLAGWGLLPHEWPDSLTAVLGFEPAALPEGIVAFDSPTEISLGERLVVSGQLHLTRLDSVWVCLDDPAGPRDSVQVGGPAPQFRLGDWPRAATAAEYRLSIRAGAETLALDTLGIAVRQAHPPAVLLLNGSPNFESTFLKRWLAERGGSVTVRTTISRERYRTEQIGPQTDPQNPQIAQIGPSVLARYDAVLIDGSALAALGGGELTALRVAVQRDGLGLLLTAEARKAAESELTRGLIGAAAGEEEWSVKPVWNDLPRRSSLAILAEPVQLTGGPSLVRDVQGRLLAISRSSGEGRVGVTLLKTPSRWVLEGEEDLYGSYWQLLLTSIARDTITRVSVSASGPLRPDHPVSITLTIPRVAAEPGAWPVASVAGPGGQVDTLPFARDPLDPRLWRSTYWPTGPGWHTLRLAGGRSVPFRVSRPGEWIGLEASARRMATAAKLGRQAEASVVADHLPYRLLLFIAIVGLLTWLWVEPRLRV